MPAEIASSSFTAMPSHDRFPAVDYLSNGELLKIGRRWKETQCSGRPGANKVLVYLPQLWKHNVDTAVDLLLDADETMDDCLPVCHEHT